jgi:hypothetical protein
VSVSSAFTEDFLRWSCNWSDAVKGRVGFADLTISDLYHGPLRTRRYRDRRQILLNHVFDPEADLALNDDQCWVWASDKLALHRDVEKYFRQRSEDD